MKILFIGDIFGNAGRRALSERLPSLIEENGIDLCIANAENIAGGRGVTQNMFRKLRKYGVHVVTGGNHSFSIPDCDLGFMNFNEVLRPLNYPPGNVGHGSTIYTLANGMAVGVINLQGRIFFHESLECPFRMGNEAIEELKTMTPVIIVDFHAEATSEKIAFAQFVDGNVSAVLGTHTHVQTADERILPGGTAFITDVGMTGPEDSIIGMSKEQVLKKFMLQTHVRFEPSEKSPMINAVILDIDEQTGKAHSITRVYERLGNLDESL
jgi:2',3'-cyclic-nucleotide 2'-phosphodiesterase